MPRGLVPPMSPLIRPLRSLANGFGVAWWARVQTSGPDVTYWFGPFITRKGLESDCLLYTSPSPRDGLLSRMPSSA